MRVIFLVDQNKNKLLPHSLLKLPSLMEIAGQPVFHWLLLELDRIIENKIEEVVLLAHQLTSTEKKAFAQICKRQGAQSTFIESGNIQKGWDAFWEALSLPEGPAVLLETNCTFQSEFKIGVTAENLAWITHAEDPEQHLVTTLAPDNYLQGLMAYTGDYRSNLVPQPIMYLKNLHSLKLLFPENGPTAPLSFGDFLGEAINRMKIQPFLLNRWSLLGGKHDFLEAHSQYLQELPLHQMVHPTAVALDTVINGPVYLGPGVKISQSVIGPYVSIQANTTIESCIISHSVIGQDCKLSTGILKDSVIGNSACFMGSDSELNMSEESNYNA